MTERNDTDDTDGRRCRTNPLPNARLEDVQNDTEGMTRRGAIRAGAGLLASAVGIGAVAADHEETDPEPVGDHSIAEHPSLPSLERNWDPEIEIGLSGARLYTRDGAEAHRLEIARYLGNGEWGYDDVDLEQYDGPEGEHEGEAMSWVRAEDLGEGGTVVFLRAHNGEGSVCSPDAERNDDLEALL